MTTAPKYPPVSVGVVPGNSSDAEPPGAIRLRLDALGIDFRAADFPTQFIDFCEENDDYEMEINEAGELVILPMVGFRGNRQETELSAELTIFRRVSGGVNISQTSRFRLSTGAIRGPQPRGLPGSATTPPRMKNAKPYFPAPPISWLRSALAGTTWPRCNARCKSGWTAARAWAG
jgi:hypothetical protein